MAAANSSISEFNVFMRIVFGVIALNSFLF